MFVGVRERLGLYGAGSLTSRPNRVPRASRNGPRRWTLRRSDLGIEIEERFQAGAQLLFDIFLAALEYVHGDVGFPAIREFHGSLPHLGHILRRQQPHAVDQRQICHGVILRRLSRLPRTRIVQSKDFYHEGHEVSRENPPNEFLRDTSCPSWLRLLSCSAKGPLPSS